MIYIEADNNFDYSTLISSKEKMNILISMFKIIEEVGVINTTEFNKAKRIIEQKYKKY